MSRVMIAKARIGQRFAAVDSRRNRSADSRNFLAVAETR